MKIEYMEKDKPILVLMVGVPGAGKSTFTKELEKENEDCVIVSRDIIRFSLVNEDEEYFSKENEVFKEFINQINENLKNHRMVVADATHLNYNSRSKVLSKITENCIKNAIIIKTPLEKCLENNELRKGTRAYVPRSVIKRMSEQLTIPDETEGLDIVSIMNIENKTFTTYDYA